MMTGVTLNAPRRLSSEAHPNCIVCSPDHQSGLHLEFTLLRMAV